ncbi:biliverdin-producing heme oxygenase [Rhodopseudomonas sp. WA056]|uniref:biliverdin-producing heme oxygenase n=1 Tax=Rhodopseudomonas sp. WA056 TaxID=2269367 RepID=UPI0013E04930|nr:biliverdin-producing heme oxygenase [Rhodopseudomonas sp. WA056]NEW85974.1 biliverdin-producing heme oxygenase [Rhodopseudomonas sp. WA056]
MTAIESEAELALGRSKRLKSATQATHERLDTGIMARRPFANRERYALFLRVQHRFHQDVDAFYRSAALSALLPALAERRRLELIELDLRDLGVAPESSRATPAAIDEPIDIPTALGWLYVAEGSNLGAAFLLKQAASLGLSETFGARHLAAAPEGRGLHWRTFTAALDAAPLSAAEEDRAIAGARAAYLRVQELVSELLVTAAEAPGDVAAVVDADR